MRKKGVAKVHCGWRSLHPWIGFGAVNDRNSRHAKRVIYAQTTKIYNFFNSRCTHTTRIIHVLGHDRNLADDASPFVEDN